MQKVMQNAPPPCHRCGKPLTLHATETVTTSRGPLPMDVYECTSCDMLEARQHSPEAASPTFA